MALQRVSEDAYAGMRRTRTVASRVRLRSHMYAYCSEYVEYLVTALSWYIATWVDAVIREDNLEVGECDCS